MKLWIKTLIQDLLAISLLLTVFYFAGRSYLEIVSRKIRGSGDPIGIVSDLAYYPKRQLSGEEYIYNLTLRDDLYEGDEISSDSFSSILMNLIDGTEISLENGSRIILKLSEDTIFFDGTISALSTKEREVPLKLINLNEENPQPIILSASSEVTIRTDDKGVFNMSVLSGEVTRGVEVIEKNEQIKISNTGETVVNRLNYILSTPENNTNWISFEDTLPVLFSWNELVPRQNRTIQIAMDTSFNRIVYAKDDLQEQSFMIELLPGEYFWRVGDEETRDFSAIGKLKVIDNTPLRAVFPPERTELTYRDLAPEQTFRWQGAENANQWILEISTNPDMNNPVIREVTNYSQIKINDLTEGDYWWQVTALYDNAENVRELSTPLPYELNITKITEIAPPLLLTPDGGVVLAPEVLSDGVRFNWKGDSEIARFEILIADNPEMETPLFQDSTLRNYVNISMDLEPGDYYWQVLAYSREGISLSSSEIRSLTTQEISRYITPLFPEPQAPIELEQGQDLRFKWSSSEKENFRFRLWQIKESEEKLISNSLIDPVEFNQYIPEKGEYSWQVDIVNSQNKVLLEGRRQSFYVNYPFVSPRLLNPVPDSHISLIGEKFLNLEWNPVVDATSYSLILTYENEEEPLWNLGDYGNTNIDLEVAELKEGAYTLSLQAKRADKGMGFPLVSQASLWQFHIDNVVIYEAPKIVTPPAGLVINRLSLLKNGQVLSWNSAYPFPQYQVSLIEKDRGNILYQRLTPERNYKIENLFPGEYQIEVRGLDDKNRFSPPGITSISVREVSALEGPIMERPSFEQIIDMSKRDTLDFSWSHKEEGTLYNISLANARGEIIFSKEDYSGTSFVFDDLSKLDVGRFIFAIKAVKEYNDVGVRRESPVISIPFEITIDTIDRAPVIISPDIQYAN